MLTHYGFQTVNSFSLYYGSSPLHIYSASTYFCLLLSFLSPSILHSHHRHANAFGTRDGAEGASQWMCGWWNGNPSGCWQTHFSGFSFIPTLSLVLEAKPPCDCAPRVWEHGNHWWQKREVQCLVWKNFFQVIKFQLEKSAMVLNSCFILADYPAYGKLNFIATKLRIEAWL